MEPEKGVSMHVEERAATPPRDHSMRASVLHEKKSKEERRLTFKADLVVVPLCSLTYFVAYLERNSIGNARVLGLQRDLKLTPDQFFNCLALFFIGYIIMMLPANLLTRKLKPNRSLGIAVISFGAICCAMAGSKNYATLAALRLLLGCGQAFIQTTQVYMSLWYKRDEIATRNACFFGIATLSGAFGGLIAYGVGRDLTDTALKSWAWLFLVEGVMALVIGVLIYCLLPRYPDDLEERAAGGKEHWLFSAKEIQMAAERFKAFNTAGAKPKAFQLWAVLKDPKSYGFAMIQGSVLLGVSNVGAFLPTFVNQFGHSPVTTQLFCVIPYAVAAVVVVIIGYASDRTNMKFPFLFGSFLPSIAGYCIMLSGPSAAVGLIASCLITTGCYCGLALSPVWILINTAGFTKRGATWAFSEVWALCFSIMGTRIYDKPPRFIKGHVVVLAFNCAGALSSVAVFFWMRRLNRAKDQLEAGLQSRGETHEHHRKSLGLEDIMDKHIDFRYIL